MKRHVILLIVLAIAGAFSIAGIVEQRRFAHSADEQLWFFDVGQGDSALIRDRQGKDLLIDGGPDASLLEGLSDALPFWDRKIDVMLVTHLDADHYAGFFDVLKKYDIGEIWWSGVAPTTDMARRFAAQAETLGIPQRAVHAGDELSFASGHAFRILWPREDMSGQAVSTTNDFAVVGVFSCGEERSLHTADISSEIEKKLLDDPSALRADLLKVAHHGSAYSSAEAFLDAVHPRDAVISDGASNRYGHPAPRVLGALAKRGIRIRRTDREGTIRYACADGQFIAK